MANLIIFLGSTRDERHGHTVAKWVAKSLQVRGHTTHIIDPLEHDDLLIFKTRFKNAKNPSDDYVAVQRVVKDADGYVAITPEYNHSYSGALKNALDCFLEEFYFKPFAIVTYTAGTMGGIRAAEHLRGVCAELGALAIPTALGISTVQKTFDAEGKLTDEAWDRRMTDLIDEFDWYLAAFNAQREKGMPY